MSPESPPLCSVRSAFPESVHQATTGMFVYVHIRAPRPVEELNVAAPLGSHNRAKSSSNKVQERRL